MSNKTETILSFFKQICKIPHVSKNEAKLRDFIVDFFADKEDFFTEIDSYGNLKIARKKSYPNRKKIILQAHLDMVPQTLDKSFDFTKDEIKLAVTDNRLHSACGTTLGADDGIGVAAAVTALLDDDLKQYNIEAIFTIEEEIGLNGAANLDRKFLQDCDYLFNLDSEDWGEVFVGCAGGVRLDTIIAVDYQDNLNKFNYKITLKNLKGGHSGCDIHLPKANAIIELMRFADLSGVKIAEAEGGVADNAIPRECVIYASSNLDMAELNSCKAKFLTSFRESYADDNEVILEIAKSDKKIDKVWKNSKEIAAVFANTPNGVLAWSEKFNVTETSSNFAIIKVEDGKIVLASSQRSLFTQKREEACDNIIKHFAQIGGVSNKRSPYPAWEVKENSSLVNSAEELFKFLFSKDVAVKVIPAGLECGIFYEKNPDMEMLSFGPTVRYPHSPSEYLEIDTIEDFYKFLQELIKKTS